MVKEFFKSLSNTSTTSVESGIFDVDYNSDNENSQCIGETVEKILMEAQHESRLICGWKSASKYLSDTETPEHSLFFFLVPSATGDYVSHMQEVLMRAFCLKHDIYVIQLDSTKKLNNILGLKNCDHACALVQRSSTLKVENPEDEIDLDEFTSLENDMIDYCEDVWSEPIQPVIRLPEK
jgi:hypothetical protein